MTDDVRIVWMSDVTEAHHALCPCGGSGPDEGCAVCDFWHALDARAVSQIRARIIDDDGQEEAP